MTALYSKAVIKYLFVSHLEIRIIKTILLLSWFLILSVALASDEKHSYIPENGYVSNADVAIKIAEAVWLPIYGNAINDKRPFKAKMKNGIWVVEGTLHGDMLGGVPIIEISKNDGRVLRVSHSK